jgi:methoxymalonate biosynthesis acyl carrier protein
MRTDNSNSPRDIIRKYIVDNIGVPSLDDDFDIFEAGIVNSLFAIELMTFLEKAFNIKVTMDDLDMANFKSVNATGEFVERKQGAKSV